MRETALFFESDHLIEFRQLPWADFARELRQRYDKEAARLERSTAITAVLPADAPTVFLCHENRDKPAVEALTEALANRGVKTWLDKQNLRGGDDWERLIPEVLEKRANYVVVLQSPRMLDKAESYFFLEINVALKRQQKFAPGVRYIIPTILERDSEMPSRLPLPALEGIHWIDLAADNGVDMLVETILDDWRKRPR